MRIVVKKKHIDYLLILILITAFFFSVYQAYGHVFYLPFFVLTGEQFTANLREETAVLTPYLEKGEDVKFGASGRQYGPVFLLVALFFIKIFGSVLEAEKAFLAVDWVFLVASFLICYFYVFGDRRQKIASFMLLFIIFFNHFSVHYQLMIKNVEFWEVFLIYLAFIFYTQHEKLLTGTAIALASMIKLTPMLFVFYFLLKDRKVFAYSIISLTAVMLFSHFTLGAEVGLLYIPLLAKSFFAKTTLAAGYFENNSIKGFLYRIFSGFQTTDDGYWFEPKAETTAIILYYIIALALLGYMAYFVIKAKWADEKDKLLAEFGLVALLMLLLSPLTSQEHMVILLVSYPAGLYLMLKYETKIWQKIIFCLSFILTGI